MSSKGLLLLLFALLVAAAACDRGSDDASGAATAVAETPTEVAQGENNNEPAPSESGSAAAENEGGAPRSFDAAPAVGTRAHCVVMGHDFTVAENTLTSEHNGRHYAFCCPACKPRFDANPGEFI